MPSAPLDGTPVPPDGSLPADALAELGTRPFGFYVHVPFCATRCGYCDFNTYTAAELRSRDGTAVASPRTYADQAIAEIALARRVLGDRELPVRTVFMGGGTPTLLSPEELGRILDAIDAQFGLAPDAEITTEANPETVDAGILARLREAGFTRISFGMQSAKAHVLAVLERTHTPGRPEQCVAWARQAGFAHVNLDLIYGTPGESDADWKESLTAAIAAGPDHISAYSLIVEEGTRLAARVRRGELTPFDDDVLADRYIMADELLSAAGLQWYEVSNWAADPTARSAHNLLYWTGGHWWGVGPGAHSHIGGVRWWNVKHPAAYAARLAAGRTPAHAREILSAADRRFERILLELRIAQGCPLDLLDDAGRAAAARAVADGLLDAAAHARGRAVLTLRGRLLADALVLDLA
ncbi:radical SAM family heme chaperone HemW [Thermobifida fusca]|uniref:Heme chaperone HemW n=2 Tax=Thermobifida fusca TaxID=2021 RepID=A0A9P2WRM4_THEFU|nr:MULTISPECIES: radical SAM family heme chaperone HemW [Thermobifida]AAZ54873.1 coproporphyrinogen III oxidase, anaerobic [Thermobifida fusca YX]EOR71986.1 coproporphyrinogen III oxidase [Thermobifida fusca TM51]MBO2529272.1 coproporphyrinogen III oxidase [Thermobifida sp.]MDD6792441.1 radical SAM family heme chaperone HemW [Thermobifida fusca]PPS92729.1 coproporphyrinogen III oxidase [Thermobifida fusca]